METQNRLRAHSGTLPRNAASCEIVTGYRTESLATSVRSGGWRLRAETMTHPLPAARVMSKYPRLGV